MDHPLHQGEHQCLLTPLVPGKELCGQLPLPELGNAQRQRAHPRGQLPAAGAIAIPAAVVRPFVGRGLQLVRGLGLKNLV